jgi:molybdopterin synthase catalytic subunit
MTRTDLGNIEVVLSETDLGLSECLSFVEDPAAGGIVHFIGTVRNRTRGQRVLRLEFEAYKPMAVSEMRKIAELAIKTFGVLKISIHHRIGVLNVGEIPVIIAASSPHRKAAFEACQFCIDTLKETVPIWKKEVFENGETWVSATP